MNITCIRMFRRGTATNEWLIQDDRNGFCVVAIPANVTIDVIAKVAVESGLDNAHLLDGYLKTYNWV